MKTGTGNEKLRCPTSRMVLVIALLVLTKEANADPLLTNAFKINQPAGANYVKVAGPVACPGGKCTTTLKPATVTGLGVGNADNTATLKADLKAQYPTYSIAGFGNSLNLDFNITKYVAINDGTSAGADLVIDYAPQEGAVVPANLHWIQVVIDNWNISGINGADLTAATGIGKPENIVDNVGVPSPYYDIFNPGDPNAFNTTPPHFEDSSRRGEPTKDNPTITWTADLFLVSDPGTKMMTIYNGVEWGWQATFAAGSNKAPEPETLAIFLPALFGLVIMLRWRKRRMRSTLSVAPEAD